MKSRCLWTGGSPIPSSFHCLSCASAWAPATCFPAASHPLLPLPWGHHHWSPLRKRLPPFLNSTTSLQKLCRARSHSQGQGKGEALDISFWETLFNPLRCALPIFCCNKTEKASNLASLLTVRLQVPASGFLPCPRGTRNRQNVCLPGAQVCWWVLRME